MWLLIASLDHWPLRNKGYPERKEFVSRGANSFLSYKLYTILAFGLSKCNRVNESGRIATLHSVPYNLTNYSGIILKFKDGLPYLFHSFRNKYFNKISLGNMLYFQNKL